MAFYIQLNLGRGVADEDQGPLTDSEWCAFRADATDLLKIISKTLGGEEAKVEEHLGLGCWHDQVEDSAHLSVCFDATASRADTALAMAYFDQDVAQLAKDHHQSAIAMISGSKLIKAQGD